MSQSSAQEPYKHEPGNLTPFYSYDYQTLAQPSLPYTYQPTYPVHWPQHGVSTSEVTFSYSEAPSQFPASGLAATPTLYRPQLRVISYLPRQGPAGTRIEVRFSVDLDLSTLPFFAPYVNFGNLRLMGTLSSLGQNATGFNYATSVAVPIATHFQWLETIPLFLQIENENGEAFCSSKVGEFTYQSGADDTTSNESADIGKKRRRSEGVVPARFSPVKRRSKQNLASPTTAPTVVQQVANVQNSYAVGPYNTAHISHQAQRSFSGRSYQPEPRVYSHVQYQVPETATTDNFIPTSVSSSTTYAPGFLYAQSPHNAPRSTPSMPELHVTGPGAVGASSQSSVVHSAPTRPKLRHTKSHNFNPYGGHGKKTVLKINGDLESMTQNWDEDETNARRRLVAFDRSQEDNIITTTFRTIKAEDITPKTAVVSCIWWQEQGEAFITSVDTIQLLESLVGGTFTVEEKNRIRRNLENFRPRTIAKSHDDSGEFFKVIMGFSDPKPRNIEKNVKVFPWAKLAEALKKVLSKYPRSTRYLTAFGAEQTRSMTADSNSSGLSPSPKLGVDATPDSARTKTATPQGQGISTAASISASACNGPLHASAPPAASAYEGMHSVPLETMAAPSDFQHGMPLPRGLAPPAPPRRLFESGRQQDIHERQWEYFDYPSQFYDASAVAATFPLHAAGQPYEPSPGNMGAQHTARHMLDHRYHGGTQGYEEPDAKQ